MRPTIWTIFFLLLVYCAMTGCAASGRDQSVAQDAEAKNRLKEEALDIYLNFYPSIVLVSWGDPIWIEDQETIPEVIKKAVEQHERERIYPIAGYSFRLIVLEGEYGDYLYVELMSLSEEGRIGQEVQFRYKVPHELLGRGLYTVDEWLSPTRVKIKVSRAFSETDCFVIDLSSEVSKRKVQPCGK